jgi:cobalamin biosynthesis Co2+ chelatase CbiK
MNTIDKNTAFKEVVEEALKKMEETITSSGASYEVIRSSGEVIVQRTGKRSQDFNTAQLPLNKRKIAG